MTKKIAVLGCKHTTEDLIAGLKRNGLAIDHCVTISPELGAKHNVAGYRDLRPFLTEVGIPYTLPEKYNLRGEKDREIILGLNLDILIVMGWQRIIPPWWIQNLSIGAFGAHGSSKLLPHGRGRSPINWSIIQGKKGYLVHLFRYVSEADSGSIVDIQPVSITPYDNCHTLHNKVMLAMVKLCIKNIPFLVDGSANLIPQAEGGASYYPKRTSEDGLIYWTDTTEDIYNLVRAITKPFPGAFGFLDNDPNKKIVLWRTIPFDFQFSWPDAQAGEIVEVFYDGTFVVKTGDGSLLILESGHHKFSRNDMGRFLGTCDIPRKSWELPE